MEECYVFTPVRPGNDDTHRCTKRRKTGWGRPTDAKQSNPLVPLLRGAERSQSVCSRYKLYAQQYRQQQVALKRLLVNVNSKAVTELAKFIEARSDNIPKPRLAAGILVQKPGHLEVEQIFRDVTRMLQDGSRILCVTLNPSENPNLKSALRNLNRHAIAQVEDLCNAGLDHGSDGPRILNYDLQALYDCTVKHDIRSVSIFCEDCEAFDESLLNELIEILSLWSDRICFIPIFAISTSVDLFQSRLSPDVIRCLATRRFDLNPIDIETMFQSINRNPMGLMLGPGLSRMLLDRQRDYIQDPSRLSQTLKYVHMAYIFSDPFSVSLNVSEACNPFGTSHLAAIRELQSFRRLVHGYLERRDFSTVSRLLDSDNALVAVVNAAVKATSASLQNLVSAVDLLEHIQRVLSEGNVKARRPWSELYVLAMSNQMIGSHFLDDTLVSLKRVNSTVLLALLHGTDAHKGSDDLGTFVPELKRLNKGTLQEVRSTHDIQNAGLRTTVVAQKVELSRHEALTTPEERTYTRIVDNVVSSLRNYFKKAFIDPKELFLHEVFIYEPSSMHRDIFMPGPRVAVERALASSQDYLGCECCDRLPGGLSGTQPATAVVYQLYLESGSIINTADLWSAFWTITESEESENIDDQKSRQLALFSRALAELKYLGLIKNSKKKADHLTKLSWKGL